MGRVLDESPIRVDNLFLVMCVFAMQTHMCVGILHIDVRLRCSAHRFFILIMIPAVSRCHQRARLLWTIRIREDRDLAQGGATVYSTALSDEVLLAGVGAMGPNSRKYDDTSETLLIRSE
jgi:hypothetical protein